MNKLKTVQIIHLAYCLGPIVFAAVAVISNAETLHLNLDHVKEEILLIIAPLFAILAIMLAKLLFNLLLKNAKTLPTANKFIQYQTAFIVKAAFLEGAALFNVVVFLLTSNLFTLFFVAACIVVLWQSRPTKEKIAEDLDLIDIETLDGI